MTQNETSGKQFFEWVKASERLPELNKAVQVLISGENEDLGIFTETINGTRKEFYSFAYQDTYGEASFPTIEWLSPALPSTGKQLPMDEPRSIKALKEIAELCGVVNFSSHTQMREAIESSQGIAEEVLSEYEGRGEDKWISVEDRPLVICDEDNSGWIATDDGSKEFIAAVPYTNSTVPGKELWWIRHCVIEESGLCVVCEDDNEPSGWSIDDVTHYQPLPAAPISRGENKENDKM